MYIAGRNARLGAVRSNKEQALCFNPLQTLIHVEVNVPRDLPTFNYKDEGYGAECRAAKLDDVVHYVLESHVDDANPAVKCPAPHSCVQL
jgi:hypothetical protein